MSNILSAATRARAAQEPSTRKYDSVDIVHITAILFAMLTNHGDHGMATEHLVGIAEIADLAGVTKQAVTNWRLRYDGFPRPIQDLQSGPVWDREQVSDWVKSF